MAVYHLLAFVMTFFIAGFVESSDVDLPSLLHQPVVHHQPEIFQHALSILNSLESAPSCHRLAARNLIETCQSFKSSGKDNVALDLVKSVFATRLAVCELTGAHATIPPQCLSMIPTEDSGIKCFLPGNRCGSKSFAFPRVEQKEIKTCLRSLETRPQWWTSYSNARQNAVVMCHAARGEAESEHVLQIHRSMAGSSIEISEALSKSARQSTEFLAAQEQFAKALAALQSQFVQEFDAGRSRVHNFINSMIDRIDVKFHAASDRLTKSVISSSNLADSLGKKIRESELEVNAIHDGLAQVVTSVQQHTSDLSIQKEQFNVNLEHAVALQEMLSTLRDHELGSLSVAMLSLQTEVQALTQLVGLMHEKHSALDSRLEGFDKTLLHLHGRTEIAENALEQHNLAQDQLFENLTSHIRATNDLASELGNNIAKINFHGLHHILGYFAYLKYFVPLVIGSALALAFILGLFGQRTRKLFFFTTGFLILSYGVRQTWHQALALAEDCLSANSVMPLLSWPTSFFLLVLSAGLSYGLCLLRTYFRPRTLLQHGQFDMITGKTERRKHATVFQV